MPDFNTAINGILTAVVTAAIPAIGAMVIVLIHKGIVYLKAHTKNTNLANILDRLNTVAGDVVQSVETTFVNAAKAGNTWDDAAKAAAFKSAFDTTLNVLGTDAVQVLKDSSMDVTALVTSKIEALNKVLNGSSNDSGADASAAGSVAANIADGSGTVTAAPVQAV